MLRALAREAASDELDGLVGPSRIEIGRLVPELGGVGGAPPGGESEALRMLELVIGVIGRLAVDRPLMLVFEDVRWADRATLRRIPGRRCNSRTAAVAIPGPLWETQQPRTSRRCPLKVGD